MATEASEVTEARRLRVWALAQALKAHGYAVEMAESEPLLAVPATQRPPRFAAASTPHAVSGQLGFPVGGQLVGSYLAVPDYSVVALG
ncbi:hypothetical protein GCM10009727_29660 [Actinomadura napierensis]|uniref:Uncharacterized protein n=1 Tax=Actinomadura napierensis TaxID=267854 RepID=A0ABN2Z1N8_9ACTN